MDYILYNIPYNYFYPLIVCYPAGSYTPRHRDMVLLNLMKALCYGVPLMLLIIIHITYKSVKSQNTQLKF